MSWGIKVEGTVDLDFLLEPPGKQTMRTVSYTHLTLPTTPYV